MPVLGICRGMEMLNVIQGGTLNQHLAGLELHRHTPGVFTDHRVRLEPGSLAERVVGGEHTEVKSAHHQGLEELGEGVIASGYADDGVVEAIELPDRSFAVGVLWHPEEDEQSRVVGALVDEARSRDRTRRPCRACARRTDDPGRRARHRRGDGGGAAGGRRGDRRRGRARQGRRSPPGALSRPATAPRCSTGSRTRSRRSSRSSLGSRPATPASRSPTRAGRWAWSSRPSATTRARRSGTPAARSPWRAAST